MNRKTSGKQGFKLAKPNDSKHVQPQPNNDTTVIQTYNLTISTPNEPL